LLEEDFGKFAPSRDLFSCIEFVGLELPKGVLLESVYFQHLMVFESEEAHINVIWEDFSVAISNGWRRRWVMVDDVNWRRCCWVDLADRRRRVLLLHDRQWIVARIARAGRIARGAGISRIRRVAWIRVPADARLAAVRLTAAAARLESWLARA